MAVIRRHKKSKFASISNELLQNSGLSFGCRGMLGYLLSKPELWECKPVDIEREGGIGKEARRALMREAEERGYITYVQERQGNGTFKQSYDVHDEPVPESERTASWFTGRGKQNLQKLMRSDAGQQSEPIAALPSLEPIAGNQVSEPIMAQPITGQPIYGEPITGKPGIHVRKDRVEKTEEEKTESTTTHAREDSSSSEQESVEEIPFEPPPVALSNAEALQAVIYEHHSGGLIDQNFQVEMVRQAAVLDRAGCTPALLREFYGQRKKLPWVNAIAKFYAEWAANRERLASMPAFEQKPAPGVRVGASPKAITEVHEQVSEEQILELAALFEDRSTEDLSPSEIELINQAEEIKSRRRFDSIAGD